MHNHPELVQAIIEGIQEKKGKNITIVNLSKIITAPAQYFVICEGNSPTQLQAIMRSTNEFALKKANEKVAKVVGEQACQWIALDFGTVLVHIFLPEVRAFYDLENLWGDSQLINIPNLD